jgi:hypothetical protein
MPLCFIFSNVVSHCRESDYRGKINVKGGSIVESTSDREFVFDFKCEETGDVLTLAASSGSERTKWILGLIAAACAVTVTDTEYGAETATTGIRRLRICVI